MSGSSSWLSCSGSRARLGGDATGVPVPSAPIDALRPPLPHGPRLRYDQPMATTRLIPSTYDDAVRALVRWHAGLRRSGLEIYSFPDPAGAVVRLVEISKDFPSSGGVLPVTFGPSAEFPFRSSVALLTPEEWHQVLA